MDLILYSGRIYTMNNSEFEAIAIEGKKIKAVGSNEEILKLKKTHTETIDLKGKLVFPGFNDSHMHLMGYGAALCQVDLSKAKSIEDLINLTKEFIEDNQIKPGTWVIGRGWNQDYFKIPLIPSQYDLNEISTEHYLFLRRACGHVGSVNSLVLDFLNLESNKTYIDGGEYENGIFKENAMEIILNNMPDPTKDEMKNWILKGASELHKMGITSVQSDDLCVFPEHMSLKIIDTFMELGLEQKLPIKVYEQSLFRNIKNLNKFIGLKYTQNRDFGNFRLGPLKILGDGSLGGRTAWLKDKYNDADTNGIFMYSQENLDRMVLIAHKNNIASAIHCIGDAMLDSALESIEKAQELYPKNLRHGIVHCQITRPEQLERMKKLNVLAYVQPIFLDYDLHIVYDRVGALADTSYAWKTMKNLNIMTSFGSDAPVETPNPIKGIHCAVTRRDLKNNPKEGYLKHEALSVYDSIYNYTVAASYTSYEENYKGKLLPDYIADIAVLDGDIFTDILSSKVYMTIVDGKVVYKSQ